jgi:hypothetical protein
VEHVAILDHAGDAAAWGAIDVEVHRELLGHGLTGPVGVRGQAGFVARGEQGPGDPFRERRLQDIARPVVAPTRPTIARGEEPPSSMLAGAGVA